MGYGGAYNASMDYGSGKLAMDERVKVGWLVKVGWFKV